MLKKEARQIYREKRMELSEIERMKMDDLLLIQFQKADLPFLTAFLTYWPIDENNEPNTHLVTEFLRFRNPELRIAYPVADFSNHTMTAVAVDIDTAFEPTNHNILQPVSGEPLNPEDLDMVLVPLVAFDQQGYRVGYGKGFYDKYLSRCRKDCIKAGLSYFEPIAHLEDRNEFDVPLDLCITPQNIYVF